MVHLIADLSADTTAILGESLRPTRLCYYIDLSMPIGGKLVLKGGLQVSSSGVTKKKKKSKKKRESTDKRDEGKATAAASDDNDNGNTAPTTTGISVQGNQTYEEIFNLEIQRSKGGSSRPDGGQKLKIKTASAEQRLDTRESRKADKYCK